MPARPLTSYLICLLIIGLAATALYYKYVAAPPPTRTVVDVPALVSQIQRLSQLVTVQYNIQKVIGLEEQKVPFGTEKVLMLVQARVLGGVDLSELNAQHIHVTGDGLRIQLPPPRILHVYLDDQQTRVWDRNISWWAVWVSPNPDLEQSARCWTCAWPPKRWASSPTPRPTPKPSCGSFSCRSATPTSPSWLPARIDKRANLPASSRLP
jgi:hypothetical protein